LLPLAFRGRFARLRKEWYTGFPQSETARFRRHSSPEHGVLAINSEEKDCIVLDHFVKKTTSLTVLFIFTAAVAALTLVSAPAYAQKDKEKPAAAASGGTGYRIAVVDMAKLMKDYKKREQKYADLQKDVDKMQAEIDVRQKGIEEARKAYEAGRDTMTEQQRAEARLKIENDMSAYKSELEKRQRTIDSNEETVLKEVVDDITKVITQVAEKEGYHLVLNSSGGPRGSVIYSSATIDLTPTVLGLLNK
jgi:Skp family chaperone for outer membrane proteins